MYLYEPEYSPYVMISAPKTRRSDVVPTRSSYLCTHAAVLRGGLGVAEISDQVGGIEISNCGWQKLHDSFFRRLSLSEPSSPFAAPPVR